MKKILRDVYAFAAKAALLVLVGLLSSITSKAQQCDCDHVITPPETPATSVFIDGEVLKVKPGETICLKSGFYMQIRFIRIFGTPGKPVTIINCGGPVQIGDSTTFGRWYAGDIVNCKYIRLTGSGEHDVKYGIKFGKSGDSGLKIGASTDTEIDHVEIGDTGFAGILAKSDYLGNPPPNAPEMNNVNIHDTYIHDTRGEGMYIGETRTPGQDFRHLRVWNNIITRTGYDLIQVANCVEDARVHNNVFYAGGLRKVLFQNKGLQIGDNSVGSYYNNFIIGSPSNSMIVMGSGDIKIFNNYMQGAGDPGMFIDNRTVTVDAPIEVYGNFVQDVAATAPFINVFNEVNPVKISGNHFEGSNVLVGFGSGAGQKVEVLNNVVGAIDDVQFTDIENDNFTLPWNSPYRGIGLMDYYNRNAQPIIDLIPDQELEPGTFQTLRVSAKDPDRDNIRLEAFHLPSFVLFRDLGKGRGLFYMAPVAADTGVYYKVRVRATDSRGEMNTQNFTINVVRPYAAVQQIAANASDAESSGNTSMQGENRIFPNPATDKLTVALASSQNHAVLVQITNHLGEVRYEQYFTNAGQFVDVDLRAHPIPPGVYYIKIKSKEQPIEVFRLLKE